MTTPNPDERHPCPCCGHLTLPDGPGGYDLCPVCFWENDGTQLRWPMGGGANGISLVEGQRAYRRHGAVDRRFRGRVRPPQEDEPLDTGWRPFDAALDWTDPTLPGRRWPKNHEALYYWRPTYWNGDPDRLPAPPTEVTGGERLVAHLREQVPGTRAVIESVEWEWGTAAPMRCCRLVADLAVEAYRGGDPDLGLSIVTALAPGLDEASDLHAPNCVAIGLLENVVWHEAWMQPHLEQWPALLLEEVRRQQAYVAEDAANAEAAAAAWSELWRTSRGQPPHLVEERLGAFERHSFPYPARELHRALAARVMSDRHWLRHHPAAAIGLAWRHRGVQSPWRTVRWLLRPRLAG
ncbi:hypothetical protein GCM10027596_15070 [Nocardioides korecus]